MRDIFFNLNLPETPVRETDRELYEELSNIHQAIFALAEQIAYLRYGINRGVGQLSENTIVDVQQTFTVKCFSAIGSNTLLHLRPTITGEFEAVVADSSQGLWANAYSVSSSSNNQISVKISNGLITGFSGLISGKMYYLSINGTITGLPNASHPVIQQIGIALDSTTLLWSFNPPIIN